jgi:hypothetical protein
MRGIKTRSFVDGTVFFTSRITTDDGLMGTLLLELPDPQLQQVVVAPLPAS